MLNRIENCYTTTVTIKMEEFHMPNSQRKYRIHAFTIAKTLMHTLASPISRTEYFDVLKKLLKEKFNFDRLSINLYNQESDTLTLFADAEGATISSLASVRVAGEYTVAGKVIDSKSPVVITNIARYFSTHEIHPLTEAGLSTTMAFPLIINDTIIGTLHCSFQNEPEHLYQYTEFFLELSPFIAAGLALILELEAIHETLSFQDQYEILDKEPFIVGDKTMKFLMNEARIIAKLDLPVLITGETGTGKTFLAQHLHKLSTRKQKNFVKVNCPALAPSLFESELFGHSKGAFTGALNKRIGRFEHAHNGTLFLDEIAELTPEMQSKLLHAVEESSFERVGETTSLAVDIRLITATNVDIPKALKEGKLRSDFYYRLASYTINLPPLRERKDDIPLLIKFLSAQSAESLNLAPLKLREDMKELLIEHEWRGNIRELKNLIHRLIIQQAIQKKLEIKSVEDILKESAKLHTITEKNNIKVQMPNSAKAAEDCKDFQEKEVISLPLSPKDYEKKRIEDALLESYGRISGPHGAAKKLGMPRSTLQYKMEQYGIASKKRQK